MWEQAAAEGAPGRAEEEENKVPGTHWLRRSGQPLGLSALATEMETLAKAQLCLFSEQGKWGQVKRCLQKISQEMRYD